MTTDDLLANIGNVLYYLTNRKEDAAIRLFPHRCTYRTKDGDNAFDEDGIRELTELSSFEFWRRLSDKDRRKLIELAASYCNSRN